MSRERQRANRRMKDRREKNPRLNAEGYNDPTAYLALRNIEREERRKKQNIDPRLPGYQMSAAYPKRG